MFIFCLFRFSRITITNTFVNPLPIHPSTHSLSIAPYPLPLTPYLFLTKHEALCTKHPYIFFHKIFPTTLYLSKYTCIKEFVKKKMHLLLGKNIYITKCCAEILFGEGREGGDLKISYSFSFFE